MLKRFLAKDRGFLHIGYSGGHSLSVNTLERIWWHCVQIQFLGVALCFPRTWGGAFSETSSWFDKTCKYVYFWSLMQSFDTSESIWSWKSFCVCIVRWSKYYWNFVISIIHINSAMFSKFLLSYPNTVPFMTNHSKHSD